MKQLLTQSEWNEITNTYQNGLGEEIQSGDLSHIEDHMKIATMLNYFPSLRSGIARKDAEGSWTATMGGETMQVSNEDIQGLLDEMLLTPYRFLVVPDNYTTPENADIGASIGIYGGPSATVQEIGNIANILAALTKRVNNALPEMQSGIEALEGEVSTLEADNSTLNTTVSTLESDSATLNTTVSQLGEDVTTLSNANSTLEGQVSTLESTVSDLEADVSTLTDDKETLEGKVSTLESDNSTLNSTVSTLEGNVTTLTSDKEALEGQVSTLESTIGDLTSRLEALEATNPE